MKTPHVSCVEKLKRCEAQNVKLRKNLNEFKKSADLDRPLLISGLRLALANQALQVEVDGLKKDAANAGFVAKSSQPATLNPLSPKGNS